MARDTDQVDNVAFMCTREDKAKEPESDQDDDQDGDDNDAAQPQLRRSERGHVPKQRYEPAMDRLQNTNSNLANNFLSREMARKVARTAREGEQTRPESSSCCCHD